MENKEIKLEAFSEQAFKQRINEKMDKVIEAEGEWFKQIEELGAIAHDFPENPTDEEMEAIKRLSQLTTGGVIFSLRQAMARYGNLLFM